MSYKKGNTRLSLALHTVFHVPVLELHSQLTFIIYRPGARGIRRNITRGDDISLGALPRGKYHH